MRTTKPILIVVLGLALTGCKSSVNSSTASDPPATPATLPSAANSSGNIQLASIGSHAVIFHAEYVGGNVDDRKSVLILGENFNTFAPTRDDCLESPDGGNWTPCDKLIHASSTDYEIIATHGSNWPHVWIKVRGPDRLFSNAALVGK